MSGELLERQRVGERGPRRERPDVPDQIEPAKRGGDADERDQPRKRPTRRRALAAALAVTGCLAWVGVGVYGIASYGHNYVRYRGFAPPADPPGVASGRLVKERFWSPAMHQERSYMMYLPPGYDRAAASGERFPVLYMLHGSPGGGSLFINAAGVGVALDKLVTSGAVRPFLIAMPNGSDGSFMSDTEWADTPHGAYESLVLETVRAVDARWPTIRDRRYRALAGNSEGAYAAVNVGLHHLGMFSLAEAWSGYFMQERTGPFARASRQSIVANSPALYVGTLRRALSHVPFVAYIYAGTREHAVAADRAFARRLAAAGGQVSFSVFPGGHTWRLWRSQAPRMMRLVGEWFTVAP